MLNANNVVVELAGTMKPPAFTGHRILYAHGENEREEHWGTCSSLSCWFQARAAKTPGGGGSARSSTNYSLFLLG